MKEKLKELWNRFPKFIVGIGISLIAILIIINYTAEYVTKRNIAFTEKDWLAVLFVGIIFLILSIISITNLIQNKKLSIKLDNVYNLLTDIFKRVEIIDDNQLDFEENVVSMYRDIKSMQIDNMLEIRKMGDVE